MERRNIPAIGRMLDSTLFAAVVERFGRALVTMELRALVEEERSSDAPVSAESLLEKVLVRLERTTPLGRTAINATGILLHTGLGRAPLSAPALAALNVMDRASILQTDVESGKRGLRETRVQRILSHLTGCQAATVVNNNAAATMLMLAATCTGKEVLVSRGQLIEIGGAFRLPEVMAMSGCKLVEVGCTNRTHLKDYERAITPETAAILHVHTSNYRVRGFASTPEIGELAALAHAKGILALDDAGSGALVDLAPFGVPAEPLISESLKSGADLCCCSGDKLIGGPQAGIICGREDLLIRIRSHPIARMMRVCKMTLATLEATLACFVNGTWKTELPFYAMLSLTREELDARLEKIRSLLRPDIAGHTSIEDSLSYIGSGSAPDEGLASRVLAFTVSGDPESLAQRLRTGVPAVFGRIQNNRLLVDARTITDAEIPDLAKRLNESWAK